MWIYSILLRYLIVNIVSQIESYSSWLKAFREVEARVEFGQYKFKTIILNQYHRIPRANEFFDFVLIHKIGNNRNHWLRTLLFSSDGTTIIGLKFSSF